MSKNLKDTPVVVVSVAGMSYARVVLFLSYLLLHLCRFVKILHLELQSSWRFQPCYMAYSALLLVLCDSHINCAVSCFSVIKLELSNCVLYVIVDISFFIELY